MVGYNQRIECAGILVNPGDLIFADYDGIVAVPRAVVEQVIALATLKASRENSSRAELAKGALLRDVYAKYGVL